MGCGRIQLLRSSSFGRKRVALFSPCVYLGDDKDFNSTKALKRQCSLNSSLCSEISVSPLEDLPQDILVRILCGVDHDDLKQLLFTSKAVKDAALIAKQLHFAFCTPRKALKFPNAEVIRSSIDIQPPNAPKRSRARSNLHELSSISVSLFSFDESGDIPSAMEIDAA